jgi:hypothetical protein
MTGSPLRVALQGMSRLSVLAKIVVLEMSLTVLLGVPLIFALDAFGMGLAVLITEVIVSLVLLPISTCFVLRHPLRTYLTSVTLPGIAAAAPAVALTALLAYCLPPSRLLGLMGEIVLVGAVSALAVFFVCLPADRRTDLIRAFWPTWRVPARASRRPRPTEAES